MEGELGQWLWLLRFSLVLVLVEDLETLPVHDGGARFIVFLLADPHLLEGGQGSQDGAADPDGVFPLRGSDDLQGGAEEQVCTIQHLKLPADWIQPVGAGA